MSETIEKTMSVSVIMPAYNETRTIEECVKRVLNSPYVDELVIVDDGSSDGTIELIKKLADAEPKIKPVFHAQNQGKGAALRTGFNNASKDIFIIQDADLEYSPDDYPKLLGPIMDGRADVVYGSRFLGGTHRVHLFWHYLGNRALTFLSNMVSNLNLSDMETCYKVFKREVLNNITIKSNDFRFEPEFTIKVARQRFVVYETSISYFGRSYAEGKKIGWRDAVKAFICIARFGFFEK